MEKKEKYKRKKKKLISFFHLTFILPPYTGGQRPSIALKGDTAYLNFSLLGIVILCVCVFGHREIKIHFCLIVT